MDSKILLGKILQRFKDKEFSKYLQYNSFGYIRETNNSVLVTRENGDDTPIPFSKLLIGIEAYKKDTRLYDSGPGSLIEFGITHINSPIYSLLHLLQKDEFR
jgi:hypothetical protein